MNILKTKKDKELTLALEGRLDTATSPDLEKVVREELGAVDFLVFDLEKLVYISSAGLRVLLLAQKTMAEKGGMVIRNANKDVMDVFELTGFTNFLKIEK